MPTRITHDRASVTARSRGSGFRGQASGVRGQASGVRLQGSGFRKSHHSTASQPRGVPVKHASALVPGPSGDHGRGVEDLQGVGEQSPTTQEAKSWRKTHSSNSSLLSWRSTCLTDCLGSGPRLWAQGPPHGRHPKTGAVNRPLQPSGQGLHSPQARVLPEGDATDVVEPDLGQARGQGGTVIPPPADGRPALPWLQPPPFVDEREQAA